MTVFVSVVPPSPAAPRRSPWRDLSQLDRSEHHNCTACLAANRGKLWQALFFLQRVRNRTLSLASERHGGESDEFAHVDELPAAERDPLRASLVSDLDRATLLEAIDAATDAFLDELRRGDPELAKRLAKPLRSFVRASRRERRTVTERGEAGGMT